MQFNFDTVDAEASKSPGAVYVLFAGFVILTTTILFTILIALMTTTYTLYDDESGTYALLQYANTILTYERSAAFYGFGKRLRSGTPGHSCGMLADIYYKPVLIKQTSGRDLNKDGIIGNDNEDAFQDLENLYGTKRVPGYVEDSFWALGLLAGIGSCLKKSREITAFLRLVAPVDRVWRSF